MMVKGNLNPFVLRRMFIGSLRSESVRRDE